MLGVLIGDIAGSRYEFKKELPTTESLEELLTHPKAHFTDDTVMTIAVAEALMKTPWPKDDNSHARSLMIYYGREYPLCGYGKRFSKWLFSKDHRPNDSYGNGAAMRISSVAWKDRCAQDVFDDVEGITIVSHDNVDAIYGAQIAAYATYLARQDGVTKDKMLFALNSAFGLDVIDPGIEIDKNTLHCMETVFIALKIFFESNSFEEVILNSIKHGGDVDTIAAIAGGVIAFIVGVFDGYTRPYKCR